MAVVVLRFSRPDRRKPVPLKAAPRRHALRSARALLLGILVSAFPTVFAASPVLAQINNWGGDVEVSVSSISVAPGESVTYSIRLTRKPTETDGTALDNETVEWYAMVHIIGVRYQDGEYKDLTLIPSIYRKFAGKHDPNNLNDDGDWDEWKDFRIYRAENWDEETQGPRATSVTLTHEVWDHNTNCPVHRRSPVTVGIGGSTPPPGNNGGERQRRQQRRRNGNGDNNGGDGNGDNNGGDGNGDNNGGDGNGDNNGGDGNGDNNGGDGNGDNNGGDGNGDNNGGDGNGDNNGGDGNGDNNGGDPATTTVGTATATTTPGSARSSTMTTHHPHRRL